MICCHSETETFLQAHLFVPWCHHLVTCSHPFRYWTMVVAWGSLVKNWLTNTTSNMLVSGMVTLNGEQQNKYPVYEVVILDYLNKKHHVKLLLMKDLGVKRLVPRALFNKVCSSLGISNSAVMNLEGEYGTLLGIDSVHLLGSRVTHFSSSQYQNVALFQSPLSRLYYILGTVGPSLDCRTFNTTQVYHTKPENSRGSTTTGCSVEENVVVSKMNMSTFQDNVKKL